MNKKTLIFAVAGYNLAETGRLLEIAKAAQDIFKIIFMSYGGKYEHLIEEAGFELVKMKPRLTKKRLKELEKVLRGETLNTVGYLTEDELNARVPKEIEFFKKIKPVAVMIGWCLSVPISARATGIPFVNCLHSTSIKEYYKAGLQNWPDRLNFKWLNWLIGEKRLRKRFNKRVLSAKWVLRTQNKLAKKYGLKEFNNFIDYIEGDHVLLADIPEWVNFKKIRPNLHYIGPLPYRSDLPIPKKIKEIPKDKPIVYLAMGSSGSPKLLKKIIEGFKEKPYRVIAPIKSLIKKEKINVPPNVLITGLIPAHKVNPLAVLSVIHGGQNTVMQACLSGTPIIGMGNHPEQEANLEACVRKGFAIRLNKWKVEAEDILDAIDKLIQDKKAKAAVIKFQKQLKKWNGPKNAAKFFYETFGK